MKTLTLRVSRGRKISPPRTIADLIGSVEGLPADLSTRKKRYVRATGYRRKRPR